MHSCERPSCCCACGRIIILVISGFFITFMVYRFTTKGPRIYLSDMHTTNPLTNIPPVIICQLEIKNRARFEGIYYDELLVSVTYPPAASNNASAVVPPFYQGFHERAFKEATLLGGPWVAAKAAATAARNNAPAVLRVDVDTKFRYMAGLIWKSKWHGLSVSEYVLVNADGKMAASDHILLHSATPPCSPSSVAVGIMTVITVLYMI